MTSNIAIFASFALSHSYAATAPVYGAEIGVQDPSVLDQTYEWDSTKAISVSGNYIYWIGKDREAAFSSLFRADLSKPFKRELVDANWNSALAMAAYGDEIYWVRSPDSVQKAKVVNGKLGTATRMDQRGFAGTRAIAIADGFMYWIARERDPRESLYRAPLAGNPRDRETLDTNWSNVSTLAVSQSPTARPRLDVYWTAQGNLYRAAIGSNPFQAEEIDEGRWKSAQAIAVNGSTIYWVGRANDMDRGKCSLFKMTLR